MLKHEWKQSMKVIVAWKSHVQRTVNQEKGTQGALASLNVQTCLLIIDWTMKFLPQRYREWMSIFFWKTGESWHISYVIIKTEESKLGVESVKYSITAYRTILL